MKRLMIIFIFLLCCLICSYSQQDIPPKPQEPKKPIFKEFDDYLNTSSSPEVDTQIMSMEISLRKSLLKAEYEYDISVYNHRREVFDWQHTSSIILFWVVIFIVFIGIFFSGVQFYISLKPKNERKSTEDIETTSAVDESRKSNSVTEFEASVKGIKVRSSVLGVIILVISLVFFYLYLIHVYPITEVKSTQQIEERIKR